MLSFAVLRHANFRRLMFTRFFTVFALQAQAVVIGWQIYSITHDPFLLGLTGLAEAAPALLSALFSGHVVDNGRPHIIYRLCLAALAANAIVLTLLAGGYFDIPHATMVPVLFAGVFMSGIIRSYAMPSSFSLLSSYISAREMPQATAWLNTLFQTGAIAGPAIAGLVYGGYGPHGAWLLPSLSLTCGAVLALAMAPNPHVKTEKREAAWTSIKQGWAYIFKNRVILSVMSLDMFAVLFGGAVSMLPAYADHVLHVGAEGLGFLRAAPAIGSVATALFLAVRPLRHLTGKMLLAVFTGFALSIIGFGLSTHFLLSIVFLACSGVFDSVNVIIRASMMQLLTPPDMKGRISSVNTMFIISSNEIGTFESGTAARLLGLVPSVVFGGVMSLVVIASIAFLSPSLRKMVIDTHHDPKSA